MPLCSAAVTVEVAGSSPAFPSIPTQSETAVV
jgi:hypothetical protein